MQELQPIDKTRSKYYSRNNGLPIYADTSTGDTFVGINTNSQEIPVTPTDQKHTLDVKYAFRPDLLSYLYYRTPLLGWYICEANGIVDPFDPDEGLFPGRSIRIPSSDFMYGQLI